MCILVLFRFSGSRGIAELGSSAAACPLALPYNAPSIGVAGVRSVRTALLLSGVSGIRAVLRGASTGGGVAGLLPLQLRSGSGVAIQVMRAPIQAMNRLFRVV